MKELDSFDLSCINAHAANEIILRFPSVGSFFGSGSIIAFSEDSRPCSRLRCNLARIFFLRKSSLAHISSMTQTLAWISFSTFSNVSTQSINVSEQTSSSPMLSIIELRRVLLQVWVFPSVLHKLEHIQFRMFSKVERFTDEKKSATSDLGPGSYDVEHVDEVLRSEAFRNVSMGGTQRVLFSSGKENETPNVCDSKLERVTKQYRKALQERDEIRQRSNTMHVQLQSLREKLEANELAVQTCDQIKRSNLALLLRFMASKHEIAVMESASKQKDEMISSKVHRIESSWATLKDLAKDSLQRKQIPQIPAASATDKMENMDHDDFLREELLSLQRERENLVSELSEQRSVNEDLTDVFQELREEQRRMEKREAELRFRITRREKTLRESETTSRELKLMLAAVTEGCNRAMVEKNTLEKQQEIMANEVAAFQVKLEEKRNDEEILSEQLERSEDSRSNLERELREQVARNECGQAAIKTLRHQRSQLRREREIALMALEDQYQGICNQTLKKEHEVHGLKNELAQAKSDLEEFHEVEKKLHAVSGELQTKKEQVTSFEAEQNELRWLLRHEREERETCNERLVEAKTEISDAREQVEILEKELSAAKKAQKHLEQSLAISEAKHVEMTQKFEAKYHQFSELQDEKDAMSEKIPSLEEELKSEKRSHQEVLQYLHALSHELVATRSAVSAKEKELESQKSENELATSKIHELQSLQADFVEKEKALEEERDNHIVLQKKAKEMEERLLALLPFEAQAEAQRRELDAMREVVDDLSKKLNEEKAEKENMEQLLGEIEDVLVKVIQPEEQRTKAPIILAKEAAQIVTELKNLLSAKDRLLEEAKHDIHEFKRNLITHDQIAADLGCKSPSKFEREQARQEIERLAEENAKLAGHNNLRQKIQHVKKLMIEIANLRQANQKLRDTVDRKDKKIRALEILVPNKTT